MNLKDQIIQLVEEKTSGTDYFVVDVKTSPSKVAVFIDHPQGVKLADCVELNRFIQSRLEADGQGGIMETHELEVSSPGMDEPLKVKKQYLKAVGKNISVLLKDGIRKDGALKSVDDGGISIESRSNSSSIAFDEIKETKLVFSFDKILK